MLSYWEKSSFLNYDVIIIGSGIVGLSTAISLKEKQPSLSVAILERAILPSGASTKNAGFACIGSLTEILDDLKSMTEAEVLELVQLRKNGLTRLRNRLGDNAMCYCANGSHELIFEKDIDALNQLEAVNNMLFPLLQDNAFALANSKLETFRFQGVSALIENRLEGEIDSGKTMRALMDKALLLGIQLLTGCFVETFEEETKGVAVFVKHGVLNEVIRFHAKQLVVCTNAFAKTFFPEEDIRPGRGQILITKPIDNLKLKGVFHFDEGYYYFREVNGRVLFGGGRNMDFNEEETTEFEYNETILDNLVEKLHTIILPQTPFEIDYAWTGIMAFGDTKYPIIKRVSEHVYAGVRMGGMGVAIGSEVGEVLAEKIVAGL
ncbi:MAG: FAD-binding oxidoreductase [Chitinophagales bacterium]|nr:FAD-binding oxidoreductase [Chitinophagales bacterium]